MCPHVGGPRNSGGWWYPVPLGGQRGWHPRNTLLPTLYYHTKFSSSRSNRLGVIKKILQEILIPRVPPFKVTRGHWNRHWSMSMTSYWCSIVTIGQSHIVSEINGDFCRKSDIFPPPCIEHPADGVPFGIRNGGSAQKTSHAVERVWRHAHSLPERFCGGDSLRRGAISSVCTFTFIVTIERQKEVMCALSNGDIFNDLDGP